MTLKIVPKPIIKSFSTQIDYPSYTKLKDEHISNKGNLSVPEGSEIRWKFETEHAENLFFQLDEKERANPTSAEPL